ncbi:phenylacetate-CoA oxygenase subunit PaaJ [Streptomyces sp. WMMC500]|uniref:1,2-phenylacetyl-CoA epoxidase subunit PaaD n=1 Tax=Streptomyces sp. WMMC500 TaxID=3015154 RepID=UPI00248B34BE|nr:1,2-phenylacetyl-CoA epoxidase subunit PaaD [Streptomyces sp. WMMC500]WBB57870.1 phenylacetate-CoA oxygenase subunit PaaJ [Streptomyces sp. WMMC500]
MVTDPDPDSALAADPSARTPLEEWLRELAGGVPDPELPMLTLAELGVVRGVRTTGAAAVEVELTPTYTGCPAVESMAEDIERVLRERGGMAEVRVRRVLAPPWTTDDITPEGRRKLAESGIAPPRTTRGTGPVPVTLSPRRTPATTSPGAEDAAADRAADPTTPPATAPASPTRPSVTVAPEPAEPPEPAAPAAGGPVRCPRCGSAETALLSPFSSTACKALRRCTACLEPFDHFKELT